MLRKAMTAFDSAWAEYIDDTGLRRSATETDEWMVKEI